MFTLNKIAKIPTKNDLGYDLYSSECVEIEPGTRTLVSTGLSIDFKSGEYLRIAPRSDLSVRGIDVSPEIISQGDINILLINNSKEPFFIQQGEPIAQCTLEVNKNIFDFNF